jgi:hypothetical protein
MVVVVMIVNNKNGTSWGCYKGNMDSWALVAVKSWLLGSLRSGGSQFKAN